MSSYPMSIGEPESSQDTPMPNTTPTKKRQRKLSPRTGPSKRVKMNQCQILFRQIMMTRVMEDKFDPVFDKPDKKGGADGMDPTDSEGAINENLNNEEAYIQEAKEDNDDLVLLIQQLEGKSEAAKQSNDLLDAGVTDFGTRWDSQQSKTAQIDILDYDERHDDKVVRECTKAHTERADALQSARENNEKVKQQVQSFKRELRQFQADLPAQLEHVRLEYESRLSQQREELSQKAHKRKENFKEKLNEKQRIIDEMTRTAQAADAKAAVAALNSKLAVADTAKDDTISQLSATNETLGKDRDGWKKYAQSLFNQKCKLETVEAKSASKIDDVNRKLDETAQKLENAKRRLNDAKTWASKIGEQLDLSRSDYATLLTEVALVQKQKLCVAKSQKTQLDGYLVKARSVVEGLEGSIEVLRITVKAKVTQVKSQKTDLAEKDKLLESKARSLEHVNKEMKVNKSQIRQLDKTKREIEAELQAKVDLLTLNTAKMADKALEIQNLTNQMSRAGKELATQRSLVKSKTQYASELEDANKNLNRVIAQLDSNLGLMDSTLDKNASKIKSQKERLQGLERTTQTLLQEKTEAVEAMRRLEQDTSKLRLDLDTRNNELISQATLVTQRDARILDLLATNTSLSQAQAVTMSKVDNLESQLSKLGMTLEAKDEKLNAQTSAAALKDGNIQRLEATKAGLIRAQEEVTDDKVALQKVLETADGKIEDLQATLDTRDRELGSQKAAGASKDETIRRLETTNAELLREKEKAKSDKADLQAALENSQGRGEHLRAKLDTRDRELDSQQSVAALKDGEIQRLEATNTDLLREQEKAKDDKADLQAALDIVQGKMADFQANLNTRDRDLHIATEDAQHTRQSLEEVKKDLLTEKTVNRTASLEPLLKNAEDSIGTLCKDLNHQTECLREERSKNASLLIDAERFEQEQLRSFEEKDILDRRQKELEDMLALDQIAIQGLQADAASKSSLLDQLQHHRTLYDAERSCLLRQLMAESMRLRCNKKVLPKDQGGIMRSIHEVRMFLAVLAGETVLVRAQRFLGEHKAFIIVEKGDHTSIVWHESLDRCTVHLPENNWYLRLEKGSDEAPIEICIDGVDPFDLEVWLRGSDVGIENDFVA